MSDKIPVVPRVKNLERHLAEAAWRGSSGFCVVSDEGLVLAANEHLCRLLNYTPSELEGMHINDFTLSKDQAIDSQEFAALIRGEKSYYHMDKTWIGKLNNPVSGHLFVMRFEDGEVIFAISQVLEGLSPEQVGAFAVMVRSLMEDWLSSQGIEMKKVEALVDPSSDMDVRPPLYKQPLFWAAVGGAGAAWPALEALGGLFRRIMDVLYPVVP